MTHEEENELPISVLAFVVGSVLTCYADSPTKVAVCILLMAPSAFVLLFVITCAIIDWFTEK